MSRGGGDRPGRFGLLAASLLFVAAPALAQDGGGALIFHIDGVRDDAGHVRVDVCTQDTFLKKGCPYFGDAVAVKGVTTVRVEGVPPGAYAAQAYHDRNDDHRVDRSRPLGLPLEEVGFTNDAPVGLRGPKWSKAKVIHEAADQDLSITLRKYL